MKYWIVVIAFLAGTADAYAQGQFAQCHKWSSPEIGKVQQAQLWNPPNSGVTLHLKRIHLHSDITTSWNIIATDTMFSELRNPGHSTTLGPNGRVFGQGRTARHR